MDGEEIFHEYENEFLSALGEFVHEQLVVVGTYHDYELVEYVREQEEGYVHEREEFAHEWEEESARGYVEVSCL